MKNNVTNLTIVENIEKYILYLSLFLLPLFFLPVFENIFEASKLTILLIGAILLLVIKVIKSVIRKSLEFNSSKFDLPVLIFMTIFLISGIFASANRVDPFVFPGTATFAILAGLYYFFVNQLPKKDKDNIIFVILGSGFVVAVMQITAFVGLNKMIPQLPEFMKSAIFTPFGNILSSIIFLTALMPFLVEKVVNKKEIMDRILAGIVSLVFMISITSSVYLILPGKESSVSILDYKTGWSIAIDSLKTTPLFGVGPGNYGQAFTKFKPVAFNERANWDLRYIQGSGGLMTIFTEVGLLGIIITLFILAKSLAKKNLKEPLYVSFAILALGFSLLPLSPSFYVVVFLLLALNSDAKDGKLAFFIKRYAISLFSVPVVLSLLVVGYLFGRAFYGEFLFTKAVKEINKGQGQSAYELVNKAVSINRYSDRYHLLSAGINLAIADNIAKNGGSELKDADKETISTLIQQAIAEGKAAVAVNPQKSSNWEALSGIYQTIIAFAKGADQFAIESLNQAITLEPTSPLLRIKLGGLYYSLGDYQSAIEVFKLAVLAKPNLANAHYNLAIAYRDNKQIDKAKEQMEIVLKLVEPNSKDYELSKGELEALNLTLPEPTPAPVIDPQLELPAEEVPQQP
jgi:tetratricopeptide (TPR) repeat protein